MFQVFQGVARSKKEPSAFGRRLKLLRDRAGMSLVQLGEKAGMKHQAVSRLERGEVEPTWPTVLKLAEALGASLDEFRSDDLSQPVRESG